jgi:nucleoside-diphosphate-sugar epimerase
MTSILMTGWSGFIGSHLRGHLAGYKLRLAGRTDREPHPGNTGHEFFRLDLTSTDNDLAQLLDGVEVVVHLAGIAHRNSVTESEYEELNVEATARLASAAGRLGVKRFIYISTIKVHGDFTPENIAITESSTIQPPDHYSRSKFAAECAVIAACQGNDMAYVILRPPLVYGPGVKANFLSLLRLTSWHIPLPLAGINNCRSLIYVENLCDIIRLCIDHPAAANQIYVVKDHDDSIGGLIIRLAQACGSTPWLFKVSPRLLLWMEKIPGLQDTLHRLTRSLLVDDSKIIQQLAWSAPINTDLAMRRTSEWFMNRSS